MEFFQPWHLLLLLIVAIPVFGVHFIPTIISAVRKTKNFWWIFVINFFLGWTIVGWIVALIWSLRDEPKIVVGYSPPVA